MNSFIELLNHWGARFAGFGRPMLVQSSLLIIVVFVLDLVVRQRVRAVLRYGLWMVVLIKLVLPPSFAAPTGLAYWLPEKDTARTVAPARVVVHYGDVKFDEMPVLPALPPPRPKLQFSSWLLLGWLMISCALMAWFAHRSRRVATSTMQAIPAPDTPEQLLDVCRRQMRIARRIRLQLSTTVSGPAVYGFWRPVILIPQRLADKLSTLQLRAVLLHELAHIKRGDVPVHYIQTLLQILYWWHPLLWLANARIRHVREQAVDETVMVEMGGEAEAYPATLLEVAKLALQRPMVALGLIGIVESRSALAQRIKHLLERPVPKSARLGFGGLAIVFLAGALLLPMARAERKPNADATGFAANPLDQPAVFDLEVEFISTAAAGPQNLRLGQPTLAGANGHLAWVLSSGQRGDLLRRIERESVVLSPPPITTRSGREARIEISGVEPFKHRKAQATASCQITPSLNGNLIDLLVSAKLTESGDVGSVFADDLNPGANQQTAGNRPGQVFAINAAGYINYDVGTAQTLVSDGGTVVLQNPTLVGADGKRMLVIVSPRVIRQSASAIPPNNPVSAGASSSASRRPRGESPPTPDNPPRLPVAEPTGANPAAPGEAERAEYFLEFFNAPVDQIFARYSELTGRVILKPVSLTGSITIIEYGPLTRTEAIQALDEELALNNITMIPEGEKFLKAVPSTQAPRAGSKTTKSKDAEFPNTEQSVTRMMRSSVAKPSNVPPSPPANSPKGQQASGTATSSEGHEAKRRFGSAPDSDIEIEAIKPSEIQYDSQTGVSVVTNDFVVRFEGAVLTARRAQINPKTGEMLAEGAVTLQRGNQIWRGERLQFNFIQQKILETNAPGVSTRSPSSTVPVLGDLPFLGRFFRSESNPSNPGRQAIQAKLKQIILPEIVFDNVPLPEALQWLSEQAREHDPDGTGLNLLLNANVIGAAQNTMIDPNTGKLVTLPPPEPLDMSSVIVRLKHGLKNVRLGDAIEAIVRTADKPIRYSIEEYAVVFSQNPPGIAHLVTRVFRLDPQVSLQNLRAAFKSEPLEDNIEAVQQLVRDFLSAAGLNVQAPNLVFFNNRTGMLMIRATTEELDFAQKAIEALNHPPQQITIEAKFMELPTAAARSIGLDLPAPGAPSAPWTRVLTAAQARAVLHDAGQVAGVDILSAPRVTTLSDRQSQVQAVEIRTIVTGIKPEALTPPGVVSANGVEARPFLTSGLPCGPILNLTPSVAPDGYTIRLLATPEVTEFVGYETSLDGAKKKAVWIDGKKQSVSLPLPSFRTRSMQAAADVYDGQTLVLANPPVTTVSPRPDGQLVTNTAPENTARRLVVFITPILIDPAGNRVHASDNEPFPPNQVPPTQAP